MGRASGLRTGFGVAGDLSGVTSFVAFIIEDLENKRKIRACWRTQDKGYPFVSLWRRATLGERFGGGAGELASLTIEGEADEEDLFAAVTVRLGVPPFLDLVESLLGRAINLELEDKDAFKRLGYEVCTTLGLSVLGGDEAERCAAITVQAQRAKPSTAKSTKDHKEHKGRRRWGRAVRVRKAHVRPEGPVRAWRASHATLWFWESSGEAAVL